MPSYLIANTIHHDGTGDFSHFVDIITYLATSPVFADIKFIPIVHFERGGNDYPSGSKENERRIEIKMRRLMYNLNITQYWYGNTSDLNLFVTQQRKLPQTNSKATLPTIIHSKQYYAEDFSYGISEEELTFYNKELPLHKERFKNEFKEKLKQAKQIISVSIDTVSEKYIHYCDKNIIKKRIFEHESALYFNDIKGSSSANEFAIALPTKNKPEKPYNFKKFLKKPIKSYKPNNAFKQFKAHPMGLSSGCYGIKIKDANPTTSDKETAWKTMQNNSPELKTFLATLANINSYKTLNCFKSFAHFKENNIFLPAYFNIKEDFIALLDLLFINKLYFNNKNIIIYLSGIENVSEIKEQATNLQKKKSAESNHNIYFHHFHYNENGPKHRISKKSEQNQEEKAFTIHIISGLYLDAKSYTALYQLSDLAGVSGDNSLEQCIAMDILPFYWSTNPVEKQGTLKALKKISQLPVLEISEAAKTSFNIYFDPEEYKNHANIDYYFNLERYKCKGEEKKKSKYSSLNMHEMIDAWPSITSYLRENKNLYNNLHNIILDNIPLSQQSPNSKLWSLNKIENYLNQNTSLLPSAESKLITRINTLLTSISTHQNTNYRMLTIERIRKLTLKTILFIENKLASELLLNRDELIRPDNKAWEKFSVEIFKELNILPFNKKGQRSMMLLKTNAYGAGFFIPKNNRDIILDDSKTAPSSCENGIIF